MQNRCHPYTLKKDIAEPPPRHPGQLFTLGLIAYFLLF